jgi:hypothetical protein
MTDYSADNSVFAEIRGRKCIFDINEPMFDRAFGKQIDIISMLKAYGIPGKHLSNLNGRVHNVSKDCLKNFGRDEPEKRMEKSGYNTGSDIYMDKALSGPNYLMVLMHELFHFVTPDQAEAQVGSVRTIRNLKEYAKANGKEIDVLGRKYDVPTLDRALKSAIETGKRFPGFNPSMN